jgi:hypothetical protein
VNPGDTGSIVVGGCDPNHMVEEVTFENVVRYGERLTEDSRNYQVQAYTKGIAVK